MSVRRLNGHAVLAFVAAIVAACGSRTTEQLFAEAEMALAAGEQRAAEIHVRSLLQQSPDHVAGRALLGQLLVRSDPGTAAFNLRRAIALGADPVALHLPLLRALIAQGMFDAVIEHIAAGPLLTGSDRVEQLLLAGAAHRGLKAWTEAESAYRTALAAEPNSAVARVELATVLVATGRLEDARSLAVAVNAEQPEYVPALLTLGMIEAAASRYTEARPWFEDAVRLEERNGKGAGYALALAPLIETQLAVRDLESAGANTEALLAADPSGPIGRYLKARVELELGNAEGAEQFLQALIADLPSFWQAYVLLGIVNIQQEQFGQAEMYLRTALTNVPEEMTARLLLAEIYLRQNNVTSARTVLEEARGVVGDGLAAALVARASLAAGEADLAAEFFDRSEQRTPSDPRKRVELAGIYIAAGEFERAVRVLDSASFDQTESDALVGYLLSIVQLQRRDHAAAAETAERLSIEQPAAAWPSVLRGTIELVGGDFARARQFLETALERESDYVPALFGLARVAVATGDTAGAMLYLRRILELDPGQLDAILGMVQLAVQRGDFAAAETWLASAPESGQRFAVEGNLHLAQRRHTDAAVAFDRAFALRPSAALALRAYEASREAGRPSADAVLLAWLARQPNHPDVNFALGSHALEAGDSASAIMRYETAIAANPRHGPALNNLAWLYDERGDSRALDLARRALDVLPNDPAVADTLGWLYVRSGDVKAGLPLLERAAREASNPEIRYHYAVALAETGAEASAAALLDELITGSAEFPSRGDARARLARLREAQ